MERNGSPNGPIAPPDFTLHRDAWGRLVLTEPDGRRHVGVEPVRAFPISDPEHAISLCDAEGRELRHIAALADLPAGLRRAVEDELAQREFMPVIRRIARISAETAPSDWTVDTDRGPTRFTLNSDDDVRNLRGHRVLIVDAQGIRYLVPDTRALDTHSRHLLERYL